MKQLSLFAPTKEELSLGPRSDYYDYHTYIRSPEWRKKRERAFKILGKKCQKCGKTKNLRVHHKHYETLYHESAEDVEIVCTDCHPMQDEIRADKKGYSTWLHSKYGDAASYIEGDYGYDKFQSWKNRGSY